MPVSGLFAKFPAALVLVLLMAACQSTEEKAADHFASAQSLLAEGDTPRALVELRNALSLKSDLHAARKTLADTLLASGDLAGAFQQYTELADLQPTDAESRIAIATILLSQSAWTEFAEAVTEAKRLSPTDPRVVSLALALDYQQAVADADSALRSSLAERAASLRLDRPDDLALMRVVIDQTISEDRPQIAMPLIEAALAQQPRDYSLQELKLRLLLEQDDAAGIVTQFQSMIALFPTDQQLSANFLQWYLSREDLAGAEAFLREQAGDLTAEAEGHVTLIEFIRNARGPDAAMAEIAPLIAANAEDPKADLYRALQASITYETGDRDAAMAAIAGIIEAAPASDQTRRIKALYAGMLTTMGDQTKAEAVVAEILAEDASQVEALLQRASWRIGADQVSDAIIDLRTALNQDPNNARILAALAGAYLRDGSVELATETLGRAVEVAPLEPGYAREYGRLLQDQGRSEVARSVLYQAWQANPADLGLVEMLSEIALNAADWQLVAELVGLLNSSDAPAAKSAANQLQSAAFLAQGRFDEAIAILDAEIAKASNPAAWTVLKVDALLQAERPDDAAAILTAAIAEQPEARELLHRQAQLDQAAQRSDAAIAGYRALLASDPTDERATRQLYALLEAAGQSNDAGAVLDAGLAAQPQSIDLRWIKASRMQAQGDLAGAVEIYEALYAQNSANPLFANNLASLLSQTVDDPAAIDRAFRIARRFRSSEVPALQDTYGWLLHLTGDSANALPKLEAAAAALVDDPSVQYHHGAVLAALGRTDEAKVALTRALDLAATTPWQGTDRARTLLQDLNTPAPQP